MEVNMKKRLLAVLLTSTLAISLLTGCGDNKSSEGDASSSEKQKFTVGFDAEYPPYGYMDDDGEYTGFDLEMAGEVCKLNGWELVKQPISWNNKDNELNSGAIDCIWNGFTMNGREDAYSWSDPYVDNSQVIVTAKDSGITALSGLKDKTVGVQAASAALDLLKSDEEGGQKALSDTFKGLQEFGDYNTAFVELEAGSIDAIAMDIGVAQYQIENRGDGKYIILDEHLNAEKYAIGFKLGNEELRDKVNKSLHDLKANGKFDELAEKYKLSDMTCLE